MSVTSKDTSATFFHDFNAQVASLQAQIDSLALPSQIAEANVNPVLTTSTRSTIIDSCLAGIAELAHRVQDAGDWLPGYDQRMYAQTIKTLSLRLETTRAAVAPKAKFTFKSTRKRDPPPSSEAPGPVATAENADAGGASHIGSGNAGGRPEAAKVSEAAGVGARMGTDMNDDSDMESYEDAKGGTRTFDLSTAGAALPTRLKNAYIRGMQTRQAPNTACPPGSSSAAQISTSTTSSTTTSQPPPSTTLTLSHLSHSILNLISFTCFTNPTTPPLASRPTPPTPALTSLTLTHLTSSLLLAPPISGPIHLTHLRSCILYIPQARQVRMHDCVDVDVYLCVGSRPVVERCRGVRVAPAPKVLEIEAEQGGTAMPNLWNQVDDFDWLREEQSPHWSEIPAEKRVTQERWSDLVPRGAGSGWLEGQVVFGNHGGGKNDGRFRTNVEELLRIVGL